MRLVEAGSGRIEITWETRTSAPHSLREHRFRSRALPDWWPELSRVLDAIDFQTLPPAKQWDIAVDDVQQLSVERQEGGTVSSFAVFFAPELWPAVSRETREALQKLVMMLDPLARTLHGK